MNTISVATLCLEDAKSWRPDEGFWEAEKHFEELEAKNPEIFGGFQLVEEVKVLTSAEKTTKDVAAFVLKQIQNIGISAFVRIETEDTIAKMEQEIREVEDPKMENWARYTTKYIRNFEGNVQRRIIVSKEPILSLDHLTNMNADPLPVNRLMLAREDSVSFPRRFSTRLLRCLLGTNTVDSTFHLWKALLCHGVVDITLTYDGKVNVCWKESV